MKVIWKCKHCNANNVTNLPMEHLILKDDKELKTDLASTYDTCWDCKKHQDIEVEIEVKLP